MPVAVPQRAMFNESYDIVGALKTDRHMIPHNNQSDTLALLPGEPFVRPWGDRFWVCFAQSLILPGMTRSVLLNFNAIFPCDLSADVEDGDMIYWDPSNTGDNDEFPAGRAVLEGDAAAGSFPLGIATFSLDPHGDGLPPEYPVVAGASSTHVQVVSLGEPIDGVTEESGGT